MSLRLDNIFATDKRLTRPELTELLLTLARIEEQEQDMSEDMFARNFHGGKYWAFIMARSLLRQLEN